ncbi:hypothetical protein HGRIS_012729 [Hohenbuehelia grisea]|uniref:Telomeric single stranded DNA binding POT1/Cdc13 domain-containing protein n=1 Tax=Hohenbuehelia grisea TaxID=104357 RepID=A0ABR3ITB6_9AGAR
MKRPAEDHDLRAPKKPNIFKDSFSPNLERELPDVYEGGSNVDGFVRATVFVVHSPRASQQHIIMRARLGQSLRTFDVFFSGVCAKYFQDDLLSFSCGDEIKLALKGCTITKKTPSANQAAYPIALKYSKGVCIKFTKSKRWGIQEHTVDTWQLKEEEEDWFRTPKGTQIALPAVKLIETPPKEPSVSSSESSEGQAESAPSTRKTSLFKDLFAVSSLPSPPRTEYLSSSPSLVPSPGRNTNTRAAASKVATTQTNEVKLRTRLTDVATHSRSSAKLASVPVLPQKPVLEASALNPPSVPANNIHASSTTVADDLAAQFDSPAQSSSASISQISIPNAADPGKMSKRRLRKLKKGQQTAPGGPTERPSNSTSAPPSSMKHQLPGASLITPDPPNIKSSESRISCGGDEPSTQTPGASDLLQEFENENGLKYRPLETLRPGYNCNLMGVVTKMDQPKISASKDWYCNFSITDPSYSAENADHVAQPRNFSVRHFSTRQDYLPCSAKLGDILILNQVKVDLFQGVANGVGYKDRMKWSIYDSSTQRTRHGNEGSELPPPTHLANGYGGMFSPVLTVTDAEKTHCARLAEWWARVQKARKVALGDVQRLGDPDLVDPTLGRKARLHRLIQDASPDVEPQGYFDCTVEVLHTHKDDIQGMLSYTVFVTDYTPNPSLSICQAQWCPPGLGDKVLRVVMWDAAMDMAKTMEPGYYTLNNVRMKISKGGYYEAKLFEAHKIRRLDQDSRNMHLEALLERKAKWEASSGGLKMKTFSHKLIEEIKSDGLFSCTVELLHIGGQQAYGLTEQATSISVTDYSVNPLLTASHPPDNWAANLEGRVLKVLLEGDQMDMNKRLEANMFYRISNVCAKHSFTGKEFRGSLGGEQRLIQKLAPNSTDEHLQALKRRKAHWEARNTVPSEAVSVSALSHHRTSSIKDILASHKKFVTFQVFARAVSMFPFGLEDCVAVSCSKCDKDIPAKFKACLSCDDLQHQFKRCEYVFSLRLQDSSGDVLDVSVQDETMFLKDVKATDLRENPEALRKLDKTLQPFTGNLVKVYRELYKLPKGQTPHIESPTCLWTINGWDFQDGTGERGHMVLDCEVANSSGELLQAR